MRVYLAARYSRHIEMQGYAEQLRDAGHEVTSRWIMGSHQLTLDGQPLGPDRERMFEDGHPDLAAQRQQFAQQDWDDLMVADTVVSFTEPPRSNQSRGGRHVEFGGALATGKRTIVVGWRENVFHSMQQVEFYATWPEALAALSAVPA